MTRIAKFTRPAIALPRSIVLLALAVYRAIISPAVMALFGPACRFRPSCSEYAREAVMRFGAIRGLWLAARRLARCHPLGGHGYDPVPPSVNAGHNQEGSFWTPADS